MDTTKAVALQGEKSVPFRKKAYASDSHIITFLMSIIGFVEVQKIDTGLRGYDMRGSISGQKLKSLKHQGRKEETYNIL